MRFTINALSLMVFFAAIPAMAQTPGILPAAIAKKLQTENDPAPQPPGPIERSPSDLLRDLENEGQQNPNEVPTPSMSGTRRNYGEDKSLIKGCGAIGCDEMGCDACDGGGPKGKSGKLADLFFDSGKQISKVQSTLPLIAVETIGPKEVNVGKPAEFTIEVKNVGEIDARGLVVEAKLPEHALVVGMRPHAEQGDDGRLQYKIDEIPARMGVKLVIEVIPQTTGNIDIATSYSVSTASNTSIAVTKPNLKMEARGVEDTTFGKNVDHTVVVTNAGNGLAENITVVADLPEGWKAAEGRRLTERVTRLPAGDSYRVHFVTQALADGPHEINYQVYIDNQLETSVKKYVQVRRAQIETLVVGPEMNYLDREGTYAISVDNVGDADATNVEVSAVLPERLRVIAVETKATFDRQRRSINWELSVLPAGQSQIVRFRAKGTSEGRHVQRFDIRQDNQIIDQLSFTTDVISRPKLNISLEDKSGPVRTGEAALVEVTVSNEGTKAAEEVSVKIQLPQSLYAKNSLKYDVENNFIIYPEFKLNVGERKVLQFETIGSAPGEGVVRVIMQSENSRHQVLTEGSVLVFSTRKNEYTAQQREYLDNESGKDDPQWRQR